MKKNLFLLILLCGFVPKILAAAEPPDHFADQKKRFLFVVENTSAMKRSAKAAQETVRELIESGVQGEMKSGDTYGIWTFDEQLNSTFPVKTWSPEESKPLALSAQDFLKKHQYKNNGKLNVALPKVYSLIKASKSITVILVTTGSEAIHGTPFDQEINTIYPQYSRELHDAKIPFVTVLIGYYGRPVAYSVNSSLGIQIPQPPLKSEKIKPEPAKAVVAMTNATPTRVPMNIEISGKKPMPPLVADAPKIVEVETKPEISAPANAVKAPARAEVEPLTNSNPSPATAAVTPASITTPVETEKPTNATQSDIQTVKSKSNPDAAPIAAAQPVVSRKTLLIAGALLLFVAGLLIFLLVGNSKKPKPSLISHSIKLKK